VVVTETRVHHLDGDGAVEALVDGLVHGGHAAARDPAVDPVAAFQEPADHGVAGARRLPAPVALGGARRGMPIRHVDLLRSGRVRSPERPSYGSGPSRAFRRSGAGPGS